MSAHNVSLEKQQHKSSAVQCQTAQEYPVPQWVSDRTVPAAPCREPRTTTRVSMVLGAETAVRNSGVGLTARCGGSWGAPGAAQWASAKTAGGATSVARLLVQLPPILHQATRCVALVTETRLNVIDG